MSAGVAQVSLAVETCGAPPLFGSLVCERGDGETISNFMSVLSGDHPEGA